MTQENGLAQGLMIDSSSLNVDETKQAAAQPGASADDDDPGVRTLATKKLPDSLNDESRMRSKLDRLSEGTENRPRSPDGEESHRSSTVAETERSTVLKETESLASEPVVQQLMRKISHAANGNDGPKTSANYCSFPSGFQQRNYYEHSKKLTDFVDVTYNPRTRQFIFLDTRGITTWDKDGIEHTVTRSLSYPKYVNKFLRNIIYARKYNVYFCLAKDFSLKVLNKDFYETCNVASDLSSVMFLIFNPVKDELITGGVKGTKVWEFKQVTDQVWTENKPMTNYGLFLKRELTGIKGGWIRKVELELQLQHLYCCSDTDILCYNMEGKHLFRLNNAHKSQINGCKYSPQARMLITCSNDNDVKVWSMTGGHVHTFRGHSRSVTEIVLHPETSSLVLTSSMDGTVRMWSLDIMEPMYTLVISTYGIEWMGLTGEKYLWTATHHDLGVWHLNPVVQFYALARCRITSLQIAGCEGKTTRLVAVGEDSSVRLVSMKDQKSLSTVLPPPSISPLQQVLGVTYNRECSMVYLLISESEIWVYTMRTDPACRTAVWDVNRLQEKINTRGPSAISRGGSARSPTSPRHQPSTRGPTSSQLGYTFPTHRATLQGRGLHQTTSPCTSIATITSHVMYWAEEGFVCPLNDNFLVLGLKDGRILFMDPMLFGHRYCELQASKASIFDMVFDKARSTLIAKSHLRDEDVFQFWSLPGLELQHLVDVPRDVTGYSRLGSVFLTGHSDGSLMLHQLEPVTNAMVYSTHDAGEEVTERRREHVAPIVAVDSCHGLQIFVSCSSDGAVKVWDTEKSLVTEIALEEPISAARFINSKGDLMLGYMNHLFVITHTKILPTSAKTQFPEENFETESEIYEDPAVRYEGAAANPDPLDMEGYLVPFNLDYNERFRGGRSSPTASNASSDKTDEEDSDGDFSVAPTEMYISPSISPSITPRHLSTIDLLTSGKDVSKEEIRSKVQALSLIKKHRSRSSKLNLTLADDGPLDFDMPQFGTSPGPSPTPSPPSSRSEFDVSEDESESEKDQSGDEDAEAMEEEADVKLTNKTSLFEGQELKEKESKEIKTGVIRLSDLKQPEEEVSKYSLSKMKIDAKSLLKQRLPVTIPKPLKLDRSSQPLMSTVAEIKSTQDTLQKSSGQTRMKTPIKKKAKKGDRVRVGDRAAANAKMSAAERPADVTATSLSPAEPQRTSATKLTVSVEGGVTLKGSVLSSTSSAATPSPQTSDPSIKSKPNIAVPALPVVQKDSKPSANEKKPAKPGDKQTKQKAMAKGGKKSILDDWKKPKAPKSATSETHAHASDEETMGAVSAGTRESERPMSSTHGADVATDLGEGTTAMYKAASRMAIANKYNPLRSKSSGETPSHTDRGAESDDNPQLSLDDPGVDTVMRDPDSSHMSRPNSSPFHGRAQSASSFHSAHSQRERDSMTPNQNGGRRSQTNSPYDIGGNDQGIILNTPSRYQSQTPQGGATSSPKPIVTPQQRPSKPSISLPPRLIRPVDRDRATRETRGEERQRENEIFIPTALADDKIPYSSEMEGRLARPNTAEGRVSLTQRPHTAAANLHVNFENDVLFDGHDTPIPRYLSCPGSPADFKSLYRNDGLHFEDNWQEKMIVRHQILKQQKEQRAQSATDRRQLLELRKRQGRKVLLGHHHCASDAADDALPQEVYVTRSDTSLHMMRKRCQSAPTGRVVPSSPPVQPWQAFGQQKEPDLSSDRPYRFRLNRSAPPKPRIPTEDFFEKPGSILVKRTHSTKSIPSKTRRYILVTKIQGDPETPLPTPLERHLLAERFPQTRHRLQMHSQEPHKSSPSMELVNISCVGEGPFS